MTRSDTETPEEFCRRVEAEMGKVGHLKPTRFNSFDVFEYTKLLKIEEKKLKDFGK